MGRPKQPKGLPLARIALKSSRKIAAPESGEGVEDKPPIPNIIEFIESDWGLQLKLFPVQKIILKAHYGIELDDETKFPVSDWRREHTQWFTEKEYLEYLYDHGRSNIREVIPGQQRRNMVLSLGRRSGKTAISACIMVYETFCLIHKHNPQKYYGLVQTNRINLISIATNRDQASLLFAEASGHFTRCSFFSRYMANNTQSYIRFQSPWEIENYGSYADDPTAISRLQVSFAPCNAKGLRGAGNIVITLDEIAHFVEQGGRSAEEVYQAVAPAAAAFTPKGPDKLALYGEDTQADSRIIMISSPLGKQGLFYQKFRQGMDGGEAAENMLCIQAPTWEVNPTIPASVFHDQYSSDPRQFMTEFGAEFSDRTMGFIEESQDLLNCIDTSLRCRKMGLPGISYFVGFDLGLVTDSSAIAVVHIEGGIIVVDLVDEIRAGMGKYEHRKRLEFDEVADWIHDYCRRFLVHEGIFDHWGGIPLEQALAKKGLKQFKSTHMTDQLNSEIYQNFKAMMFDQKIRMYDLNDEDRRLYISQNTQPPEHAPYILQVLSLQSEFKSKYITRVFAPQTEGKHDDMADALSRAVWVASTRLGKASYLSGSRRGGFAGQAPVRSYEDIARARAKSRLGGSDPKRMVPKNKGLYNWYVKRYSSK